MCNKGTIVKRLSKGLKVLKSINGQEGKDILKSLRAISPDMAKFVIEFPYGDIYSRPGLDIKTRELITIASLVTLGFAHKELKAHVRNALNAGCTQEQITETIIQMSIYAGFPAALNGLAVAQEIFDSKEISLQKDKKTTGKDNRHQSNRA